MFISKPFEKVCLKSLIMEFIKTTHGRKKLALDGYLYVKQKTLVCAHDVWECEFRRQGNCSAKVTMKGQTIVSRTNEHTHAPISGKCKP